MCVGCWVKVLLGISKYYSWNITLVQILMNHVFIELLFIQFYTRERSRNTLDFFDTVMFNFRAYLKIKSWSLNYLLRIWNQRNCCLETIWENIARCDYIFILNCDDDIKYVTPKGLKSMMNNELVLIQNQYRIPNRKIGKKEKKRKNR